MPRQMANALRILAIDAVEQAKSGHPGMPMGMADVAVVLFSRFLKFDAQDPQWPDRDRFVLSAGHGSMLLYALLYLCGFADMGIDQLKRFRQLGSPAAGHPEHGSAGGIETTTGPLGQGLANAVGMAIAERMLNARFGDELVSHRTWALVSDGDLMEGISHEAASLAGHLNLSRLTLLWDDNRISIDGATSLADSSDIPARFRAAGWHVAAADGHDQDSIEAAIAEATEAEQPGLVACRTIIGHGAPNKQNTAACHGSPLGAEEAAAARRALGWELGAFQVPEPVLDAWRITGLQGRRERCAWNERLDAKEEVERDAFLRAQDGQLPSKFADGMIRHRKSLADAPQTIATRAASKNTLQHLAQEIPELTGGSADLTGSTATRPPELRPITASDFSGRFLHYGVREHAMLAAMNGMALHGGVIPYGGTFLVFSDYARPALRLAALMGLRVIFVASHDSIGVGEDGPTHQPVEHLAALRAIPNLLVLRPADAVETAECWEIALAQKTRPSVLVLSRQKLPPARSDSPTENPCLRGGYELLPAEGAARVTLLAGGSEVSVAMEARALLQAQSIPTRIVSMPCLDLFAEQPRNYRENMLGAGTIRVAVEAGVRQGWDACIGEEGDFIGMEGFGASAPAQDLYRHFGITPEKLAERAAAALAKHDKHAEGNGRNGGRNGRNGY